MRRQLFQTTAFVRALKKIIKRKPKLAQLIQDVLTLLQDDAFDPRLETHKLAGKLSENWACSAGYDLRIIFAFKRRDDQEVLLLDTIGSHDEVY